MERVVVVGGGVLGTMHAWSAIARGHQVVQLEREPGPRGASVRNFGLIWVSGRSIGPELDLSLRARELWEKIATDVPGIGFRAAGSLTLARRADEMTVLEEVAERPDAALRGWHLLSPAEIRQGYPILAGDYLGGLRCDADAIVEPRLALGALREKMQESGRYSWLPGRQVLKHRDHGVADQTGRWHDADLVVLCPGAAHSGIGAEVTERAPLRRVRIQMLETEPTSDTLTTALADGDSLRYYPAYAGPSLELIQPQEALGAEWRTQLLLVKRLDGSLTIGDTHTYAEPFPFDVDEAPYRHLLATTNALFGQPLPAVSRRWAGVYSQVTDDSLYFRAALAPGVIVVTGPGGRGMTMSPGIAEETFD